MKLILASTSPRRCELLASLNIPFEVIAPTFEEKPTNLSPLAESLYFAEQKALSVAKQSPNSLILASDTLIECEGKKIGKPADAKEATEMLKMLSGREHRLYTAVVLFDTQSKKIKKHVERVIVKFHSLSDDQIQKYIETGEPFGKAGGYAAQGEGRKLIEKIDGELEAVVGLPVRIVKSWLVTTEVQPSNSQSQGPLR